MPIFRYTIIDEYQQERSGILEAANQTEVLHSLLLKGWAPLDISEGGVIVNEKLSFKRLLKQYNLITLWRKNAKVKAKDLVIFFRQLSLMIKAGYTVLDGLKTLSQIIQKPKLHNAVTSMINNLQEGKNLEESMAKEDKIFSTLTYKLVGSGEKTGDLQSVLEYISEGIERSADVKRTMVSALTYPTITFLLAITVIYKVITSVIPKFVEFLETRNTELPPITQFMVDTSLFLEDYGLTLAISIGASVFAILAVYTTEKGKNIIDNLLLKLPVIGNFLEISNMASMGWLMSMLLRSQVKVLDSLKILSDVTQHATYSSVYQDAANTIINGKTLYSGMSRKEVPHLIQHLVSVGEKTGELEIVMKEIGEYYAKLLQARVKVMLTILEPAMLLFVGGVVGTVYMSIFSAIYKVSAGGM